LKPLILLLLCLSALSGQAERFLTVDEALRISFPDAKEFRPFTVELRAEQVKAIERDTKQKIRKREFKAWIAEPGGVLLVDQVIGKHDFIDYTVALSTNGAVLHVEILEYREHYGGEVRQPKWRQQFRGRTARDPLKLGGDVYNITGATLSCRHVTEGVKKLLAIFELAVRPRLPAGGGLRESA